MKTQSLKGRIILSYAIIGGLKSSPQAFPKTWLPLDDTAQCDEL